MIPRAEVVALARDVLGDAVVRIERVPVGFGSENWRVVTKGGVFVLKVGPPESAAKWNSTRRAHEIASDVGLPIHRLVHFSASDVTVVRVFEWVDGLHPTSLSGQPEKLERFAVDLATSLARLHTVEMSGFTSRLDGSAPLFGRWRDYVAYRLGQIRVRSMARNALDPSTLDRACEVISGLAAEVDHVVQPSLCHRDLHPDNLLVNAEGRLVAVLDWDMAEAWDAAGEWFKLELHLFPSVPGVEAPFTRAYRAAIEEDLPLWDRRTRLVSLMESMNTVANVAHVPGQAEYAAQARTKLHALLNAG
jgi:aminoglycoside phosphotransferase (APT) family kinase protein